MHQHRCGLSPPPPPSAHVARPQRAAWHVHSRHANRTVAQSAAPPMQPQPHPRARQRRSSRWRTSVALVSLGAGVALVALRSIFPSGACTRTHQCHALGCHEWALSRQATHRSRLPLLPRGHCTATRPTAARRVPTANRRSTDPKSVQQAVPAPQGNTKDVSTAPIPAVPAAPVGPVTPATSSPMQQSCAASAHAAMPTLGTTPKAPTSSRGSAQPIRCQSHSVAKRVASECGWRRLHAPNTASSPAAPWTP